MGKIYCKNCDYFYHDSYQPYPHCCKCYHPNNFEIEEDWEKRRRVFKEKPQGKNKSNDCSDFKPKRKWWEIILGLRKELFAAVSLTASIPSKGGHNPQPTIPRPENPPKGQGGKS